MTRTTIKLLGRVWPMLLAALATACGPVPDDNGGTNNGGGNNNGGGENGGDYVAPEVPETPVSANLFRVDYFTTLEAEGNYFTMRDAGVASQFIGSQEAPRSVAYMFDLCNFTVGEKQPAVQMAYDNKAYSFFLQTGPTKAQTTEGTAMVSRYASSSIVGTTGADGVNISGVTFNVGLSKSATLTFYSARIESVEEVEKAVEHFGVSWQNDGVLIASVLADQKEAISSWLKSNFKGYRVEFAESKGTPYDVMVLCPAMMVCRSIEQMKTINLPYWKVTMEKFF